MARQEVTGYCDYDYVIVNDDLEQCVDELRAIVMAERKRARRARPVAERIISTFKQRKESRPIVMTTTKIPGSRFEFVTVASARARQLLKGCTPRVEVSAKPARVALREVEAGAVSKEVAAEVREA